MSLTNLCNSYESQAVYYGPEIEDPCTQYARDVVSGRIIAGKAVIMAAQRHINDLERDFEYYYDLAESNKIQSFFSKLRFTDGSMAGEYIRLVPFQQFIIGSLFGWKHKETGYRRFNKSYIQLSRKQAKSLLNSGIAIKMTAFDGYPNAQGYCTATKRDQAKLVWKMCDKTINASKDLRKMCKSYEREGIIKWMHNGATITALGRDTNSIDGFDPHVGIVDEYHSHKTNQMVKLLEDGTINQVNNLISIITTAGFDLTSPCKNEYDYCINMLNGLVTNENYFTYISQMDKEDDVWNEGNWIKCGPLMPYIPQALGKMKQLAIQAKDKGGEELVNFQTKSLNMWVEWSDKTYLNKTHFKNCESDMTLEDVRGHKCFVGVDLSSGGDLTSIGLVFKLDSGATFIHSHSFIPELRLAEHEKSDLVPYRQWALEGLLTPTGGVSGFKTDYKYIIQYLKEIVETYDLKIVCIGYDNHNASSFLSDLEGFGVPLVDVPQSCKALNDATTDFKLNVDDENVYYNKNNDLLKWSFSNAEIVNNSFGEIKIDKNLQRKRIDPCDAILDAWKVMLDNVEVVSLNDRVKDQGIIF